LQFEIEIVKEQCEESPDLLT